MLGKPRRKKKQTTRIDLSCIELSWVSGQKTKQKKGITIKVQVEMMEYEVNYIKFCVIITLKYYKIILSVLDDDYMTNLCLLCV